MFIFGGPPIPDSRDARAPGFVPPLVRAVIRVICGRNVVPGKLTASPTEKLGIKTSRRCGPSHIPCRSVSCDFEVDETGSGGGFGSQVADHHCAGQAVCIVGPVDQGRLGVA